MSSARSGARPVALLDVLLEVIKDTLPALALLLSRMFILSLKGFTHFHTTGGFLKRHPHHAVISQCEVDVLVEGDVREGAFEIKTHGAIPGLHAVIEGAPLTRSSVARGQHHSSMA